MRKPTSPNIATVTLRFLLDGTEREWTIGAHPRRDTEATLKAHLLRWLPHATWLGCEWE